MNHLVVIEGPIGAGKTSVMHELCTMQRSFSAVEPDTIKRMINPRASSEWRRDIAHRTSLFLAEQILRQQRSVVTEAHSRWPEQGRSFARLADSLPGVTCSRYLVCAPLETCLERARDRHVPGILYTIDDGMVRDYYHVPPDTYDQAAYDSSLYSPRQIATSIILAIGAKNYTTIQATKHEERV